jgi:hypothetical protein
MTKAEQSRARRATIERRRYRGMTDEQRARKREQGQGAGHVGLPACLAALDMVAHHPRGPPEHLQRRVGAGPPAVSFLRPLQGRRPRAAPRGLQTRRQLARQQRPPRRLPQPAVGTTAHRRAGPAMQRPHRHSNRLSRHPARRPLLRQTAPRRCMNHGRCVRRSGYRAYAGFYQPTLTGANRRRSSQPVRAVRRSRAARESPRLHVGRIPLPRSRPR